MTNEEQRKLATEVAKTSNGVSVKFGRTNGRNLLHLIHKGHASTTIYSAAEWHNHPWHKENQAPREIAEAA